MAITFQYMNSAYIFSDGGCVLVLAIGFYIFMIAMCKTIRGSLLAINRNLSIKLDRKRIFEQLVEFLEFHSRMKRLDCEIVR